MLNPSKFLTLLFFVSLVSSSPTIAQDSTATERLAKQNEQFKEQIIQVADNVYVAVGFSVSNVSMIVGDDGVVIVDTGMMGEAAITIAKKFRDITDKPVKAIVYTHSHGDHTGGAPAFLGDERPQIWGHVNFGSEARPWKEGGLTYQNVRGARQAGFKLPPEQRINNGVAPARYPKRGGEVFSANEGTAPTHFVDEDRMVINVAGIELELTSAPGETNDGISVWHPAAKVLFAGDTFIDRSQTYTPFAEPPIAKPGCGHRPFPEWLTTMLWHWSADTRNRLSERTKSIKS